MAVVITGWPWEAAEQMTVPRFERLVHAWAKIGPLAPYLPKEEGAAAPSGRPAAPPEIERDPNADPLGYLMAHPEILANGR